MKYFLSFFLLAASVLKAQPPIPGSVNGLHQLDLFNVKMKSNVACYRIPALVVASNGDLIAAIDERGPSCADLKANDNINIVMRKSRDNGKTWTDIRTLVDYPLGRSASDPSFINDSKTGAIFMFYNYMDLNKEKDIYYLHVIKSTDNGEILVRTGRYYQADQ
jgi:sialidase-1